MRIETNEWDDTIKLKGCEEDEMNREMGPQLEVEKMIDRYRWLALPVRTLIERLLDLTADSLHLSPTWGCISCNTPDVECHSASI